MFDIDHLYLATYNYNFGISEDGQEYVTTVFNPMDNDQYSTPYYQNTILDCLMTLLKDTDNSINSLYKSIDNDTESIEDIARQIPEQGSTKNEPFNFGSLHEQVNRKNDYITGKTGIGPFALNVTNHVLTQLFGVRFRQTKFTTSIGLDNLSKYIDNDDNYISSWMSGFINSHVDIVKDPYISKVNVNPFTYNMLNLLVRSGFGSFSVWFLAQPIIRDIARASEQSKDQYTRDFDNTPSNMSQQDAAIHKALLKYFDESEITEDIIYRYTISNSRNDIDARIYNINYIKNNIEILKEIAKNPNIEEVEIGGQNVNVKDFQKKVFFAWKSLERYSIALGDLVQHTKIDTRKHGKSLIAINQYLDAYNNIVEGDVTSIWDMRTIKSLVNNSWIDLKTKLAIEMPSKILGKQVFNANPKFIDNVIYFGKILSRRSEGINTNSLNIDALNFISRSLQTAIKSEYFIGYAKEFLQMTDKDIADLFIGNNSMANLLMFLKSHIENDPEKYGRFANNHLLNQLYVLPYKEDVISYGNIVTKPKFITIRSNIDNSSKDQNLLIDSWVDLLNDSNKTIRFFARKLIVYSFLTSGEFSGWNKLFKYVPPQFIRGEIDSNYKSYSSFVEDKLNNHNHYLKYLDQIVCNNYLDPRIIRRVRQINDDNSENYSNIYTSKGTIIAKIGNRSFNPITQNIESYITVKDGQDINIFKLAGSIIKNNSNFPVYVKMKKLGYHDIGVDIYEYGWNFNYGENESKAMSNFDFDAAFSRIYNFLNLNEYISFGDDQKLNKIITDLFFGRLNEKDYINTINSISDQQIYTDNTVQDVQSTAVLEDNNSQTFNNEDESLINDEYTNTSYNNQPLDSSTIKKTNKMSLKDIVISSIPEEFSEYENEIKYGNADSVILPVHLPGYIIYYPQNKGVVLQWETTGDIINDMIVLKDLSSNNRIIQESHSLFKKSGLLVKDANTGEDVTDQLMVSNNPNVNESHNTKEHENC